MTDIFGSVYFFDCYDRTKVKPEEIRFRDVQMEMDISQILDGIINFDVIGEIAGHRG
jgi:hypothetical protein